MEILRAFHIASVNLGVAAERPTRHVGRETNALAATGEQRIYANLLLTIGVVKPPAARK